MKCYQHIIYIYQPYGSGSKPTANTPSVHIKKTLGFMDVHPLGKEKWYHRIGIDP